MTFYVGAHVGHDCIVGDHVLLTNLATLGRPRAGGRLRDHRRACRRCTSTCGSAATPSSAALAAVPRDVIPFGMVWGNHAHLEGLNLVGLKRRGFSREQINTLRAAYRALFGRATASFQERVDAVAAALRRVRRR